MASIIQQFNIFLKSSFSLKSRNDLFELIWKKYNQRITIFVRSMIKNKSIDIGDISQDIMLKVYENLHKYNPLYSFNTWIYSIARNHCLDCLKKKVLIYKNTSNLLDTININQNDSAINPDENVILSEMHHIIKSYIGELNEIDRQISFLRFYEKLSYREISKIIDIPAGTIKYRVHNIRSGLKIVLEK